jgi:hypothetical protein
MQEPIALDQLTSRIFEPLVGSLFVLPGIATPPVLLTLTLVEVEADARHARNAATGSFSLLFTGPREWTLPQRIYRLEHPTLGVLEVFLVPIGQDNRGFLYQAVFNRGDRDPH